MLDDVPRVTGAVVATISCGGVLLGIDVPLGLMVLIGVPAVLAGLQLTAPMIAKPVEEQQAEIGRATALATDLISGHDRFRASVAKANGATRYRIASLRSLAATQVRRVSRASTPVRHGSRSFRRDGRRDGRGVLRPPRCPPAVIAC